MNTTLHKRLFAAALALLCAACATQPEDLNAALYDAVRSRRINEAEKLAARGATLTPEQARALYALCGDYSRAEEFLRPLFPDAMPQP